MNSAEEKRALRQEFTQRRALLQSNEKDGAICRNFLSFFSKERNFFVYCAFRTEVQTRSVIEGLRMRGACVCVPKIVRDQMLAVPFSDKTAMSRFGIPEPVYGEDTTVQIAAVPLLAVDGEGYRLGYGGGYYDRYFQTHPDVLRVGLCYSGQAVAALTHEQTDVPLDAVVTEDGVRFFSERLDRKTQAGV